MSNNNRLDPIVNPGVVAQHEHNIVGGSRFGRNYDYDDLLSSSCTTAPVSIDKVCSAHVFQFLQVCQSPLTLYVRFFSVKLLGEDPCLVRKLRPHAHRCLPSLPSSSQAPQLYYYEPEKKTYEAIPSYSNT